MLDGADEQGVVEEPAPALEAFFHRGLVAALPRDPLDQVRDVGHAIQLMPVKDDIGRGHLSLPTEVLLMPDDVRIEKQLVRELVDHGPQAEQDELPQARGVSDAAHAVGQL